MNRYIICAMAVAAVLAAATLPAAEVFQVIVNEANNAASVSKSDLAAIFLKKTPRWPQGGAAAPVDQVEASAVRAAFSKEILGKSVPAVASYWQQQIFSGRDVPPPQKSGDASVVDFVKANPGAVGYVAGGGAVPSGVKVLAVVEK
jgi:ABC-type phosphate transport system substrate-binding protein